MSSRMVQQQQRLEGLENDRAQMAQDVELLKDAMPPHEAARLLVQYTTSAEEPLGSKDNEWTTKASKGGGCCTIM